MKKYCKFLAFGAAVVILSGCSSDEGNMIAEVNDIEITSEQFDAYLKFKRLAATDEKRRESLLDHFLEREAMADIIAKEGGLDQTMLDAELREFRKEAIINRYFDSFLKDKVGDDAIRNYYVTHADEFEKRKVHVSHILLRTSRNMGETERKAKLTTAQEAYSRIRANEDFAEVAEALSEDLVSSKKGGDLGWMQEGSIDPRFSETVFNMKVGEISEPFETAFGYHIVRVDEGPKVVKQPFEKVRGDIRYRLRNQFKNAELERLRSKAKIEKKS